jgi:hypothetical protein
MTDLHDAAEFKCPTPGMISQRLSGSFIGIVFAGSSELQVTDNRVQDDRIPFLDGCEAILVHRRHVFGLARSLNRRGMVRHPGAKARISRLDSPDFQNMLEHGMDLQVYKSRTCLHSRQGGKHPLVRVVRDVHPCGNQYRGP